VWERRDLQVYSALVRETEERVDLENLGVDERIILKQIYTQLDRRHGLDIRGPRQAHMTDCGECGNETSGYKQTRGIFG